MFGRGYQVNVCADEDHAGLLRDYLVKECDCELIYALNNEIIEQKHDEITFGKLYFCPPGITVEQRFVPILSGEDDGMMMLHTLDENNNSFPLIEYTHVRYGDEKTLNIRLYYNPTDMPREYHADLKKVFRKAVGWLRKNCKKKKGFGPAEIFYL